MQSGSIDSPPHQKQQQQQQRDARRRIIPSLSITLPDGNIQPLDVSPLRAADDPRTNGTCY